MKRTDRSLMPSEASFKETLQRRNLMGSIWRGFYAFSIFVALLVLIVLFTNVVNSAFGSIATTYEIDPDTLSGDGRSLGDLDETELVAILLQYIPNKLPVLVRDRLSTVAPESYTASTLRELLPNAAYPDGYADVTVNEIRALPAEEASAVFAEFMALNLGRADIETLVLEQVANLQVVDAWTLFDAVFNYEPDEDEAARMTAIPNEVAELQTQLDTVTSERDAKEAEIARLREADAVTNAATIRSLSDESNALQSEISELEGQINRLNRELDTLIHSNISSTVAADYPEAKLKRYHSWLDSSFLETPMSSVPANAGIRTALLGSLLLMVIVIALSLPIGVGAAVYLEEYAKDNFLADIPKHVENFLDNLPLPKFIKGFIVGLSNINQILETNVRNLAGVPSIIYGMLGLAIFVRMLAPITSGVAFGVNVVVPDDSRIADMIDNALPVTFTFDERGEHIIGFESNALITEAQERELVSRFRYYGTASLTNTGNLSQANAEREVARILGLSILNDLPDDADSLNYVTLKSGYLPLQNMSITAEQFSALVENLRRMTAFTVQGRTILSAALTLSLLILPIIIINAQEALRAVPNTLREGSYGLGATKWQTIWRTVLPAAVPGIMTGTILAVSRAVGETAPLIVVGASTFLLSDPTGAFSKFTVLPIQVWTWTGRPQEQYQFIAAAAIIVLLFMVISLNAVAIILRNRYSQRI